MKNRAELMKKYPEAIYVSIHMNKYSDNKPQGAQIFYSHKTEASKTLALCVQTSIKEYLQQGNKREVKPGNKDIYLLENATVPTVIVECGFLSNETDLSLLKDDEYQSKLAFAISVGIKNYSAD